MSNTISSMSANIVARELDCHIPARSVQGDTATQAFFRPLDTFTARSTAMLAEITALGFDTIDLWGAYLHYHGATPVHIDRPFARHAGLSRCGLDRPFPVRISQSRERSSSRLVHSWRDLGPPFSPSRSKLRRI